jgi:hypothetical protein
MCCYCVANVLLMCVYRLLAEETRLLNEAQQESRSRIGAAQSELANVLQVCSLVQLSTTTT